MTDTETSRAETALTDAAGVAHPPAEADARIVSLVPSLTELLFDLGLGARVVGRTHYCVHPQPAVTAVPSVGGTKKVRRGRLLAVAPTHVLVNVDETPRALAEEIAAAGVRVVVTHPNAPLDNLDLYRLIGGLFGAGAEAERLAVRFRAAHDALVAAAAGRPRRRVLYLIWKDPWMTVSRDTYIARTLALAGWDTACHDPAVRYPQVTIDAGLLRGIDLVLFGSEPYRFTEDHLTAFHREHGGATPELRLIDGEMTSWYGSRAVAGLDYLRAFAGLS